MDLLMVLCVSICPIMHLCSLKLSDAMNRPPPYETESREYTILMEMLPLWFQSLPLYVLVTLFQGAASPTYDEGPGRVFKIFWHPAVHQNRNVHWLPLGFSHKFIPVDAQTLAQHPAPRQGVSTVTITERCLFAHNDAIPRPRCHSF